MHSLVGLHQVRVLVRVCPLLVEALLVCFLLRPPHLEEEFVLPRHLPVVRRASSPAVSNSPSRSPRSTLHHDYCNRTKNERYSTMESSPLYLKVVIEVGMPNVRMAHSICHSNGNFDRCAYCLSFLVTHVMWVTWYLFSSTFYAFLDLSDSHGGRQGVH